MMDCERAQELMLDSLVVSLSEADRNALHGHLATCSGCAKFAHDHQAVWDTLDYAGANDLDAPVAPRLHTAVREEAAALRAAGRRRRTWRAGAGLAAALALFALGAMYGRASTPSATPAADTTGIRFMLVMRPGNVPEDRAAQFADEFGAWMADLRARNALVGGEAFTDTTLVVGPSTGAPSDTLWLEPNGYMIVRAINLDHAHRIAAESPTRAYGGSIEVRAIRE